MSMKSIQRKKKKTLEQNWRVLYVKWSIHNKYWDYIFNPRSPGVSFTVQKMDITSPISVFYELTLSAPALFLAKCKSFF